MSTSKTPFSEQEVAEVAESGAPGAELDDVDTANIDGGSEPETPFEKLVSKGKRMSAERVRTVVESLLFVSDRPLSLEQLVEATGLDSDKVQKALGTLQGERREGISGIVLYEVAGAWQFRTDPESVDYVRRFLKVKPQRLTRAAVETLAIIAYRQPVTRPEVEEIRGVDSGAVLKALLERRLVKILGKKEEVGRPILYGTTREFLEFFALKDLGQLPTLREFHELSEEHQEIVEKEAPPKAEGTLAALADPAFKEKLAAQSAASEAALAELEAAIVSADGVAKSAHAALGTVAPEAPPPSPSAPTAPTNAG